MRLLNGAKLNSKEYIRFRFDCWVRAWLELVCAILSICTFTIYHPWFDMHYMAWSDIRRMQRKINKQEVLNDHTKKTN